MIKFPSFVIEAPIYAATLKRSDAARQANEAGRYEVRVKKWRCARNKKTASET